MFDDNNAVAYFNLAYMNLFGEGVSPSVDDSNLFFNYSYMNNRLAIVPEYIVRTYNTFTNRTKFKEIMNNAMKTMKYDAWVIFLLMASTMYILFLNIMANKNAPQIN